MYFRTPFPEIFLKNQEVFLKESINTIYTSIQPVISACYEGCKPLHFPRSVSYLSFALFFDACVINFKHMEFIRSLVLASAALTRFFSSSAEDRSSLRLPTHPQKNGREKTINKKKKNLILYCLLCANVRPYAPLILTTCQIHHFIEGRVTADSFHTEWGAEMAIKGQHNYWLIIISQNSFFSHQNRVWYNPESPESGVMFSKWVIILIYYLVTPDCAASVEGRRKHAIRWRL